MEIPGKWWTETGACRVNWFICFFEMPDAAPSQTVCEDFMDPLEQKESHSTQISDAVS